MVKYILRLFILLQLVLAVSWFAGEKFIPIKTTTFLGKGLGETSASSFFWSRANFDGFYYAKIARDGYQYLQQAFFPFYPQLIKIFQKVFASFIVSGLFISNLAFVFAMIVFWKLLEQGKIKEKTIKKTLLFLILFPTSFYLVSVYTESLFLLFALSSFYFARKRNFLAAGILAGFASYTRLAGIFLLPALLVEYYEQESRRAMKDRLSALKERITHPRRNHLVWLLQSRATHFKNLFFIAISSWGLLKYMYFLKKTMGSWFYFVKVQPDFGAGRSVDKLILLYQVFWRYLKMIFTVAPSQWLYFNVWFEFVVAVLFLALLLWGWHKREEYKIRLSWLVFAGLAYLLPTLTGTFSSLPRYVLVCFPGFIVLARVITDLAKQKRLSQIKWVYLAVTVILLVISSAFFFRGYWLA